MPRLGVPSTTDSARVIADVCGEPAPLPRSTNPRHNDRPGGTFPRVVQPLIETWEKGRKEGAWSPPLGRKPRVQAAAQRRRFDVPRPTSKRPSQRQPPRAAPGKPLISRSFQAERQKAGDGHFGALPMKVTAEDKPQKEPRSRDHARPRRNPQDMRGPLFVPGRKIPLRRDFHGDCPDHRAEARTGRSARVALKAQRHGAQIIPRKLTVLPRIGAS
jgi:hypothetical protein